MYADGREADFSTADAEGLGITGVIGEFTTFHACCAARVTNIQLIADAVDGALVMPGEQFSLNEWVGQRTVEKGYVCAGALLGNELVDEGTICIGGGTSQFTTTLYNAAFFAGLEDISHQPHSVYFSRYPKGARRRWAGATPADLRQQHPQRIHHQDLAHRHFDHRQDLRQQRRTPRRGWTVGTVRPHRSRHDHAAKRRTCGAVLLRGDGEDRADRFTGMVGDGLSLHHLPRWHPDHRVVGTPLRRCMDDQGMGRLRPNLRLLRPDQSPDATAT